MAEMECGKFEYEDTGILHWVYNEIVHNNMVRSLVTFTSIDSDRTAWETSLVKIVRDTSWM